MNYFKEMAVICLFLICNYPTDMKPACNACVYMDLTFTGTDHRVESLSVAFRHIETLNSADKWNHPQTIEWCVKNR